MAKHKKNKWKKKLSHAAGKVLRSKKTRAFVGKTLRSLGPGGAALAAGADMALKKGGKALGHDKKPQTGSGRRRRRGGKRLRR